MGGEWKGQIQGQLASGRERGQGKVAAGHNPYQPSENPHLLLSPPTPHPRRCHGPASPSHCPNSSGTWEPHPTSTNPLATGSPQLRPHAQLCFFLLLLLPLGPCLKPRSSTLCQSQWGLRVCVTPRPPATKQPPQSILQREPRPHPGGPNPKHPPVTLPPSQAGPDSKHPPQTHRCPHSEAPSQVPCKDTRMSQSQVTPDPKHPKGEGVQQHLPLGSPSCRPQAGQEGCPLLGEPHV